MNADKISVNQREKKRFHADERRNNQRKSAGKKEDITQMDADKSAQISEKINQRKSARKKEDFTQMNADKISVNQRESI